MKCCIYDIGVYAGYITPVKMLLDDENGDLTFDLQTSFSMMEIRVFCM